MSELYQDWNRTARAVVGSLRTVVGRHPEDPLTQETSGEYQPAARRRRSEETAGAASALVRVAVIWR
ncbi:MmyB family transcriptional regulator [Streptomyces tubercidicus]|uniref:MmyB family transcriptional regulator n=1 Tax=Streptomyces tubercidicus TaxID=47759 RepID=UPI003F5BBA7A